MRDTSRPTPATTPTTGPTARPNRYPRKPLGVSAPVVVSALDPAPPSKSSPPRTGEVSPETAPPSASSSSTAAVAKHRKPARRGAAWLLLMLLGLGAFPLVIGLPGQATHDGTEIEAIATADETWRRQSLLREDGLTLERLVPVRDTEPIVDRPPGLVWLHLLAFAPLDADTATAASQVFRARLVSVVMSLVALGAVFWAGLSIGGRATATLAALVFLGNPLMVIHGRLATADAVTTGWVMLALAGALWAIRPLRPPPRLSRQALGWGLCGLSLGLATLTHGPAAVPLIVLPLGLIALICPRRLSHLFGLAAAGALGALMVIPWALYAHQLDPLVWQNWSASVRPSTDALALAWAVGERSLLLWVGCGIWGLLVVAALVAPWAAGNRPVRRELLIGWSVAVMVAGVVLAGPVFGGSGRAGVLVALPVLALVTGQWLKRVGEAAREGEVSAMWRAVRLPTAAGVIALSLVGPILLYRRSPDMATMHAGFWVGTGVVLVLLGVLSVRWARRESPGRVTGCWAVWSVVAATLVMIPASRGSLDLPHARRNAEHLEQQRLRNQTHWPAAPVRPIRAEPRTGA